MIFFFLSKLFLTHIFFDSFAIAVGSELAQFSRRYFFSGALLAYVLVSAYAWAQFPYDNLCDPENPTVTGLSGTYDYVTADGTTTSVTVTQDYPVVFCRQSWLEADGFPFPPTPKLQPEGLKWMNASQERLTTIYGWTSVAALVGFIVIFFGSAISRFCLSWFKGVTEPEPQNQHIDFSSNPEIFGYVPQMKRGGFPFPFLACNIDQIDSVSFYCLWTMFLYRTIYSQACFSSFVKNLIGWKDPYNHYDYHNLIFDVPWEGLHREKYTDSSAQVSDASAEPVRRPIFSIIKHYPPKWMTELQR